MSEVKRFSVYRDERDEFYMKDSAAGAYVLHSDYEAIRAKLAASEAEIAELKAELEATKMVMRGHRLRFNASEAMRQDAERYRWLRGDTCPDHSQRWTQWEIRCWNAPRWTDDLRRSDLDNAIDAAIAADKPKEPTS